jgi:putative NIF3 family GTP cyclohydrolase 1 type 2
MNVQRKLLSDWRSSDIELYGSHTTFDSTH